MAQVSAADAFLRLVDLVARLRAPDGCPWDREQTIDSLKPYVLEETYEVLEAIDRGDHASLREELGDFIFEAVLVAQVEQEAGRFSITDALTAVTEKLIRRHPHVFARDQGEPALDSAGAVVRKWEELKALERAEAGKTSTPKTLLSGIPDALPALLRADQISRRARSVGFDWNKAEDVVDKIAEEVEEIREVVRDAPRDHEHIEEEMGDLLFAIASLSRKLGVEPETALRKANAKFTARFTAMETTIAASGRAMKEMTLEDMEAEWQLVKCRLT
jgi:nucleoside triphosphate diphosphatase